jgi:nitrogen fixation/metabolism regulation signal transduction histidine kinase
MRRSFTFALFLHLLPVLVLAAALPWLVAYWLNRGWEVVGFSAPVLLALMWWTLRRATAPMRALFRALAGATGSYRDGEYNFGVHWHGDDELGQLVRAHGELGEVLRQQRQGLVQRELLLDTMIQNTPVAMLLVAAGGDGKRRVVFSNLAARRLLHGGWKLEGERMEDLVAHAPEAMREALDRGNDGLFSVPGADNGEEDEQTWHLARRQFQINGRRHELLLLRRMTSELRRQEVQTWKKVIRVISHELNNSLAPIASLAHSGQELLRRERTERLGELFATIEERARHLEGFVRGYARFAKLPAPQLESLRWESFAHGLQQHIPFVLDNRAGDIVTRADPAQLGQALLNLLKNAKEAGDGGEVVMRLSRQPQHLRVDVLDRGPGMNEAVLHNALTPFYSTKRNGTGLGLALTREIVEAHGGHISLRNREGGGLCVSLSLPMDDSTPQAA